MPRGADAVVMVEHTEAYDRDGNTLIEVRRPAAPGQFIAFAGSDLARGETVLRAGQMLTSREIGMLAAVGCAVIEVWRKPRVAIISTGDEIIAPGEAMRPGAVYDSNAAILAAAVEEAGGIPQLLGIGPMTRRCCRASSAKVSRHATWSSSPVAPRRAPAIFAIVRLPISTIRG